MDFKYGFKLLRNCKKQNQSVNFMLVYINPMHNDLIGGRKKGRNCGGGIQTNNILESYTKRIRIS